MTAHGVEMRLALHLNCAATLLKLERPRAALAACKDALALDARNAKALLRRAKAHIGVGSTEGISSKRAVSCVRPRTAAWRAG